MFDPEFQKKALSLVMGFIMEFSGVSSEPKPIELTADNLNVSTISVSCLKSLGTLNLTVIIMLPVLHMMIIMPTAIISTLSSGAMTFAT